MEKTIPMMVLVYELKPSVQLKKVLQAHLQSFLSVSFFFLLKIFYSHKHFVIIFCYFFFKLDAGFQC